MDFELSEERQMLKDTADRFIREQYTIEKRHEATASDDGFDRAMWAEFCELGLPGALVSPEAGGFGGTGEDIALVFEALGRGIVVEPFLPTLMACTALAAHDKADLIEQAVSGEALVAWAHVEPEAYYTPSHVATTVNGDGSLTGRKAVVINGATADWLVVTARSAGEVAEDKGLGLFLVAAGADGVDITNNKSIDGPHVAEVTLENAAAEPLGMPGTGWPLIEKCLALGTGGRQCRGHRRDGSRQGHDAGLPERTQAVRPPDRRQSGTAAPNGRHADGTGTGQVGRHVGRKHVGSGPGHAREECLCRQEPGWPRRPPDR